MSSKAILAGLVCLLVCIASFPDAGSASVQMISVTLGCKVFGPSLIVVNTTSKTIAAGTRIYWKTPLGPYQKIVGPLAPGAFLMVGPAASPCSAWYMAPLVLPSNKVQGQAAQPLPPRPADLRHQVPAVPARKAGINERFTPVTRCALGPMSALGV